MSVNVDLLREAFEADPKLSNNSSWKFKEWNEEEREEIHIN